MKSSISNGRSKEPRKRRPWSTDEVAAHAPLREGRREGPAAAGDVEAAAPAAELVRAEHVREHEVAEGHDAARRVALAAAAAVVLGRVRVRRFDELRAAARRVADPAVDGRRAEAPGPRAHAQAQHTVGRARLANHAQRRAVRQLGDFLRVERDAGADDAALLRADLGVAVDDVSMLHEVALPAPFGDRRRHRERRRRLGLEGGHALVSQRAAALKEARWPNS